MSTLFLTYYDIFAQLSPKPQLHIMTLIKLVRSSLTQYSFVAFKNTSSPNFFRIGCSPGMTSQCFMIAVKFLSYSFCALLCLTYGSSFGFLINSIYSFGNVSSNYRHILLISVSFFFGIFCLKLIYFLYLFCSKF